MWNKKTEIGPSIVAIESRLDDMEERVDKIIDSMFSNAGDKGLFVLGPGSGNFEVIPSEELTTLLNETINKNNDDITTAAQIKKEYEELRGTKLSKVIGELARIPIITANSTGMGEFKKRIEALLKGGDNDKKSTTSPAQAQTQGTGNT